MLAHYVKCTVNNKAGFARVYYEVSEIEIAAGFICSLVAGILAQINLLHKILYVLEMTTIVENNNTVNKTVVC